MPTKPKRKADILEHKKNIKKIKNIFALFPEKKKIIMLTTISSIAIPSLSFARNITGARKTIIKKKFENGKYTLLAYTTRRTATERKNKSVTKFVDVGP